MIKTRIGYKDVIPGVNIWGKELTQNKQHELVSCDCGKFTGLAKYGEFCPSCEEVCKVRPIQDYAEVDEDVFIYPHLLGALERVMPGLLLGRSKIKPPKSDNKYYFREEFRVFLNRVVLEGTGAASQVASDILGMGDKIYTNRLYFACQNLDLGKYKRKSFIYDNDAKVIASLGERYSSLNFAVAKYYHEEHKLLHTDKSSTSRSDIMATRLFYTDRATILPHGEGIDDVHMTYVGLLNMLRLVVEGYYIRDTSYTFNEIVRIVDEAFYEPNEFILNILHKLIDEGLYMIMVRNPAQSYPSLSVKKVTKITKNNIFISNTAVGGFNADFDGDQNNCKLVTSKDLLNMLNELNLGHNYTTGVFGINGKIAEVQDSASVINGGNYGT